MRKIISILIILALVACTKENQIKLDLKQLATDLNTLEYIDDNNQVKPLFNNDIITSQEMNRIYNIDSRSMSDVVFSMPKDLDDVSMFIIVLPCKNKTSEVKNEIDNFFNEYKQEWELYFPREKFLINNRLESSYADYLIYIVSNDNARVLNYIKEIVNPND